MIVHNYTKVKIRDKKIYKFQNWTIPGGGVALRTLQIVGALLVPFTIIGVIICAVTGTIWYNPLEIAYGPAAAWFLTVFIGGPTGIGIFLSNYKIQNYPVIAYLSLYFTSRKTVDKNNKAVTEDVYSQDCFVEKI